jgi:hypothetical protein
VGLINIQWAIQDDLPYIIEANPRASRTVPFVAKAIGHPIAKYASLVMSGATLPQLGFTEEPVPENVSVKEVVLPFNKFAGGPPGGRLPGWPRRARSGSGWGAGALGHARLAALFWLLPPIAAHCWPAGLLACWPAAAPLPGVGRLLSPLYPAPTPPHP